MESVVGCRFGTLLRIIITIRRLGNGWMVLCNITMALQS